jgi:dTDP-4-amino-4,6-dideoxygalactose transaminase
MPVLADIGADLNISPDEIERRINHRTKAIIPVHLAGLPCEMSAIWSLAKAKNLMVIEDAAHAIGSEYRGVPIGGGASAAVVFSFYATKNLVSGEGGMVTTRCQDLDSRMRMLSLHGMSSSAWNRYHQSGSWSYTVEECGFKYNMSDIMASIGLQQLRRLDAMTDRRRQIAEIYNQAFANEPALEIPPTRDDSVHCWHLYILRLNLKLLTIDRDEFIEQMKALQIGCGVHFIPIPLHPLYRKGLGEMDCPRAIAEFPRLVSLPLGSRMTADEANRVVDAVKHIVGKGLKQTSPATLVLSGAGAP